MPASNVAMRLSYKAHSSAVITPGVEPTFSSDPGATGGQQLRRVSSSLNLKKSTFKSAEVRTDQQIYDFRHGGKHVEGEIAGELSPKTYQDFMAALLRGSWSASISKSNSDFTSMAATASSSKFTVGGSTWAAQNFRVGDVIRFTNLSTAAYNNKNYLIIGLSGVDATVSPAPTADMGADTAFTVATTGRKLIAPTSSLVASKWAFEHYYSDIDLADLFTECRIGSMKLSMPAEGIATTSFGVMGRNMTPYDTGTSPFFTGPPTVATTTTLLTSIGGQLSVGGTLQGIITGMDLSIDIGLTAPNVAFSPLVAEIFSGSLDVTGTMTALFNDSTLVSGFINETEFEVALMLASSNADAADYISIFMPRVKLGGADRANAGQAGIPITLPFQALLKGSATGYDNTTISIGDSQSA